MKYLGVQIPRRPSRSIVIGWAFLRFRGNPKRIIHPSPARCSRELWMAGKKGEATMANNANNNQFRDDETIILEQLRDGKMVKNMYPKIGGRLRLAHEENDQLSITTEVIRYDESADVRDIETTLEGNGKVG